METKLMVEKSVKIQTANGTKGFLIWDGIGKFMFRVYEYEQVEGGINTIKGFKDYDVLHSDLQIIINDDDSSFSEYDDGRLSLDHSPSTLGHDDEQ